MFFTKLALNRPVSVILFVVTLVYFGVISLFGFQMAYQPEIQMPTFLVVTPYIGAEPEIVESTISKKVEKIGSSVTGFTEVTSYSEENVSTVVFMFDFGVDNNQTYIDLKTEVDALELPSDASDPMILEMSFNAASMMSISITAEEGEDPLSFATNTVTPQMEALMGVADVEIYGGQEDYVRIVLDPTKLTQYGLSMSSISSAISLYDFELPLGNLDQGSQQIAVSSGSSLNSLSQLQNVALTTSTGAVITLKEVAEVQIGAKEADSISRYDGRDNVSVEIIASQDSNVPDVAKDVSKVVANLQAQNPNYTIEVTYDESETILSTLMSVVDTLLLGVLLCMFVLYLFFGNFRASLIVGSSIPVSLIITLICMNAANFELNMVTSSALVIAIGMMVDNSIVVLESIFKVRAQEQDSPLDLESLYKGIAYRGCDLVGPSVVASTITTIVVYLPLVTLGGVSGQMFVQLSFTIVFAMVASLFSATVLVPMLYFLLKPEEKISAVTRLMHKLEHGYVRLVAKVIRQKVLVVFLAIGMLVGSFVLLAFIPLELMPETDSGTLVFTVDFRPNSKLSEMDEEIRAIEDLILADERIEGYNLNISGNSASISAYMKDGYSTFPLVDEYLEKTMDMANMSVAVAASGDEFMTSMMGDITLITSTLHGYDYEALKAAALAYEEDLYQIPGVTRVSSSQGSWGSAKASIQIDPKKALDLGMNPIAVAQSLRMAVSGLDVLTMDIGLVEYDVVLEYPQGYSDDIHHLMTLPIDTPVGQVPVSAMAEMKFEDTLQSIKRMNGYYVIDLTISPLPGTNEQVAAAVDELEEKDYGAGIHLGIGPGIDYITDEITALVGANATAVFLVFMVMAMQFESIRFSLMVMTSVSFSFIGSFGLLFITGQPLTTVSLMGVLMLMGIVVNNGILFVDSANNLRKTHSVVESLILSGKIRMRPIIMTTMTTVLSMVPLALAMGEGTEMMQSMGIIIIGGLIASTILVLFLMPTFYLIIDKKDKKNKKTPPSSPSGTDAVTESVTASV